MTSAQEIAVTIARMQRRIEALERRNQLGRGSIVDGPLDVYSNDGSETLAMSIGEQYDGSYLAAPLIGPVPPTPSRPALTPGLSTVRVRWDGAFAPDVDESGVIVDDQVVAPMDFGRVEIHASTDLDFDALSADTIVGTYESPRGGERLCALDVGETYAIRLVTRTMSGGRSAASETETVEALQAPGSSDGNPPTGTPVVKALGQPGQVLLQWEPIANTDPVSYRIYGAVDAEGGVPLDNEHLIGETNGTSFTATGLRGPDGPVPLSYLDDSLFRVMVVDADGDGPASAVVRERPVPISGDAIATTDGEPPATSPAVTVISGIGAMFLRWLPTPNNDPVTYEVYACREADLVGRVVDTEDNVVVEVGTVPIDAAHRIARVTGTQLTVRKINVVPGPNPGDPDEYDGSLGSNDYTYFAIVATDADTTAANAPDPGPTGFNVTAQATHEDIAANSVRGINIVGETVTGDKLEGQFVLGSTVTTGQIDPATGQVVGQRVDLSPEGLRVVAANGRDLFRFPTDPDDDPLLSGNANLDKVTASGPVSMTAPGNMVGPGASLVLGNGVTAPGQAPTFAVDYSRVRLDQVSAAPHEPPRGNLGTFALVPAEIECIGWHPLWQMYLVVQRRTNGFRVWWYDKAGFNNRVAVPGQGLKQVQCDDWVGFTEWRGVWGYDDVQGYGMLVKSGGYWTAYGRVLDADDSTPKIIANYLPIGNEGVSPVIGGKPYAMPHPSVANRFVVVKWQESQQGFSTPTSDGFIDYIEYNLVDYWGDTTRPNAARIQMQGLGGKEFAGVEQGIFDYDDATRRLMIGWRGRTSTTSIGSLSLTQTGTNRTTADAFPTDGQAILGFCSGPDGRFVSIRSDGYLTIYGDNRDAVKVYAAFSWYDDDPETDTPVSGNDGRHETDLGPVVSFTSQRRALTRLTAPAPPDRYDPTKNDEVNHDLPTKWRLYAAITTALSAPSKTSGAYKYQTEGSATTALLSRFGSEGLPALNANTFPNSTPGRLTVADVSTKYGRPEFSLDGNGLGWWHAVMPPGAIMEYAGPVDTTLAGENLILPEVIPGFLRMWGETVSRLAYPALSAIIGTRFNLPTDTISTIMRLPDVRNRGVRGAIEASTIGLVDGLAYPDRAAKWLHAHSHAAGSLVADIISENEQVNREPRTTGGNNAASRTHRHDVVGNTSSAETGHHPYLYLSYLIKT